MSDYPDDPILRGKINGLPVMDQTRRTHLRLVDYGDAAYLSDLRSRADLNLYLSGGDFRIEGQQAWIEGYKRREQKGIEYYFVIVCEGQKKGTVRLYNFRNVGGSISFCFGSWIVAPPRVPGLSTYAFLAAMEIGFEQMGFRMCHFDVRRENARAIAFYERAGALCTGKDELDSFYTYSPAQFKAFRLMCAQQVSAHAAVTPTDKLT